MKYEEEKLNYIELEISEPIITTYTHHAHLLSILGCYPQTYPWIYSNYIQVFMNKDYLKHSWGDFYFPFPYELWPADTCKWLYISKVSRNSFDGEKEKLINFIFKALLDKSYVSVGLNHSFLTRVSDLMEHHDTLIHGIDMVNKTLCVSDFFQYGKYKREKITFSEFFDAFYNYEDNHKDGRIMIYLYKLYAECNYEFSIANIENSINSYMENKTPEYWTMYNNANGNNIAFGRDVYDSLFRLMDQAELQEELIEILPFYLCLDHKRMMIKRFCFLEKLECYKPFSFEEIIRNMEEIIHKSENIINLLIKYDLSRKTTILSRVRNILLEVMQIEFDVLKNYKEKFICISEVNKD